jgi:hypothetical protein
LLKWNLNKLFAMTNSPENSSTDKDNSKKEFMAGNGRKIALSIGVAGIAAVLIIAANFIQLEAKKVTAISGNPTLGYDIHVTVNRHDSAHLDAQMDHHCKLDDRIVAVCQLYATTNNVEGGGPQLAQIEFIITDEQYLTLPLRERANWHNHAVELTPERGAPTCVELPEGLECGALVEILQGTYGKVITIWDPADGLPNYPPYAFNVESPFALNQDLNDDLENEWPVGDEETGSADEVPNCGIQQAGPCGSAH